MTIYGFFSIASADKEGVTPRQIDPNTVMVRARTRQHLQTLQERFPFLKAHEIQEWAARDYGFRIICPKSEWVLALTEMAQEQEWSNFKNEAEDNRVDVGSAYISCLHRVWSVMLSLQPYIRSKVFSPQLDLDVTANKRGKGRRKKGDPDPDLWKSCVLCGQDTLQPSRICLRCQSQAEEQSERVEG